MRLHIVKLRGIALLVGALSGCVMPSSHGPGGATQTDRLMQVYPELKSGRFLILADFEDEKQMDLFRLIGVSEQAQCVLDRKGGRAETGKNCLTLTTGSPDDVVVVGNTPEGRAYLKRDWRAYDLLLMSLHSPTDGLALDLNISSGSPSQRMTAQSTLPLEKGWNVLRLDLTEIGELIPLDDVQEMRWSVSGVSKATPIRLDDVVLTSNREDLLGDSKNAAGALYVQRVGRRWNVGAGGRFELGFSNGQITSWYNLAADPNRLRNLVRGTTLGPSPVVVHADGSDAGDFAGLGKAVVARQRLLEMSAVRAVVACEWRFVDDPDRPLDDRPFQRWVYSIYPSGPIHVEIEATARTESWSPPGLGLATTLSAGSEGEWTVSTSSDVSSALPSAWATARNETTDSVLLFTVSGAGTAPAVVERRDPAKKRVSLVVVGAGSDAVARWSAQLFLGAATTTSGAEVALLAKGAIEPPQVRIELGASGSGAQSGMREASRSATTGCYELQADQGRLRILVDGRKQPLANPCFEVGGIGAGESWVYVDRLIMQNVARTSSGKLVFQIPEIVRRAVPVEVLGGSAGQPHSNR